MDNYQLWQAVLGELELLISRANFTTWFKSTFIFERNGAAIIIGVPNAFTKAWLENKYHEQINKAVNNLLGGEKKIAITYKVSAQPNATIKPSLIRTVAEEKIGPTSTDQPVVSNGKFGLNNKYAFNSFIVGKGNELAHAASKAVAEKPGLIYNPLFIYGGVGLGKTHLIQAVGNQILINKPNAKILYVNSEKFTNDFVASIKSGETEKFKKVYRTVDVLLIDDIQFIAGKEQTQEEFFHTFNELHQNNKQIIISSDRPPKALGNVENRLISRFEWGMIADISAPDYETRIAILQAKCQEKNFDLDKEIIQSIAENIKDNIRELEGALNRIIAFHQLNKSLPTVESTRNILFTLNSNTRKGGLTSKRLIHMVAQFFDISIDDLVGECRKKELVVPRQITMFLMREEMNASYPNIGAELGGRDHTTAMHAYQKISQSLKINEKIKNDIDLLRQRIYE